MNMIESSTDNLPFAVIISSEISQKCTEVAVGAVVQCHVQVVLGLESIVQLQDEWALHAQLQHFQFGKGVSQLSFLHQFVLRELLESQHPARGHMLCEEYVSEASTTYFPVDLEILQQNNF